MLRKLDKGTDTTEIELESKEGEQTLLSSNRGGICSPSLDFLDTSYEGVSEDKILDYLARIISTIYLKQYHGYTNTEKGSDILPGVNKRTG